MMAVPIDFQQRIPAPLQDLHTPVVRMELENATAEDLPDLQHEMECCLSDLPKFEEWHDSSRDPRYYTAQVMAWCFEAGRRYGLIEALAQMCGQDDDGGQL